MFFLKIKNRINTKLLLINLIGIITATALLTVFGSSMIRSVFQKRYEDKLQTPGRIFLAQYTYKDILPYMDRLAEREHLAAESERYLQDRQYVLDMEKNHADKAFPAEYFAAKERMEAYIETLNEIKDDKYYTIKKRMLELRVGAGLTYFYIFADLGVPGMYVHIFDAVFQGSATSSFGEDYGTPMPKLYFTEAEEVYRTGESAIVLSNMKGEMHDDQSYYSFMPIKDEYGNVVAVIGTDINMQSLQTQLQSFIVTSVTIMVIGSFLLLFAMYFALRAFIIKPILKLTAISSDISAGNIDGEIPAWIRNRKDEMGILGKSFDSMGEVLREMLKKNDVLFEAAMSGRLDARSDPSSLGGLFAQLANKINDTLDVIGSYFDSISSPLAILNAQYDVVYTNRQFKRTFAGISEGAMYQRMLGAGDHQDIGALKKRLAARLEQEDFSALEWFDLPEGRRCLSLLCSRVTRDGQVNGAIIVVTDATELVTAKDKALSANKAKSEFLSRVSHELRTPLNVILSMAKLGLADKRLEESTERFEKIVTSSSHLSNIINDVLEMSRMESGKTQIKREPLRLKAVAEECVELLSLRAKENGIALASCIDPALPATLIGDEFRIRQILINLLSNAIKFTAEGRVSLDVAVTERAADRCTVLFTVSDTGIGMSEAFQKKIFAPFEQEDSFLSRRYEGSGLGLSISHHLAGLMGGTMAVESRLEEGSRFTFAIPFVIPEAAEEARAGSAESAAVSLHGKRILLVDDIEINRMIVLELFADTGAELEEACDGEEAVQKYMSSPPGYYDCILMDIQMPKMDGYTAAAAIRASGRADHNIPIIAMTANALREDIDRSFAAGMNDHIAKPIDFDECLQKAKRWCR
ncbi:MAG: ATP-binding protein [Clostridia bacterium]|nr:ATP-binding protein [Clostridia bacterium]